MKKKLFKLTSKFAALALAGFAALNAQAEATLTGTQVNEGVSLTGELDLGGITDFAGITNSTGLVTEEIPYNGYYVPDEYLDDVAAALGVNAGTIETTRVKEDGVAATYKYSTVITSEMSDYTKGLVDVTTVEGTTEKMYSVFATPFATRERWALAGDIDININFQDEAKYNMFVDMYNEHGIVFLFDGIGYIHESTSISFNVSWIDDEGAVLDTWGGGAFVAGSRVDGENALYLPEPSTATMSLLALAGLLARRRRKAA